MKISIIGAGIAGLTAAWYLQKLGKVTVYEKSARVGGWIETVHQDGFCFEKGPRGFRATGKGKQTLKLCQELGLELIPANETAKRRFICKGGTLEPFSPKKIASGLWHDLFATRPKKEDETLEEFFSRHLGKKATAAYIDPLARGIFGGDYQKLSARSCFPNLWNERSLLFMKREKAPVSLYSFKDGMESLPKALAKQLNAEIRLDEKVENPSGDVVIWAIPFAKERATLTTVSMGWHRSELAQKGYGFLVPSTEPELFYGMTWDSMIFPQQEGKTRICVMIPGEHSKEELLAIAYGAVKKYTGIQEHADSVCIGVARDAIAQYHLGHHAWVEKMESTLPPNHYLIGSSFRGVGVNDCVADGARLASLLAAKR